MRMYIRRETPNEWAKLLKTVGVITLKKSILMFIIHVSIQIEHVLESFLTEQTLILTKRNSK